MVIDLDKLEEKRLKDELKEKERKELMHKLFNEFIEEHENFTTANFLIYYFIRAYLTTLELIWLSNNYVEEKSEIFKRHYKRLKEYSVVREPKEYKEWVLKILRRVSHEMKIFKEELAKETKQNETSD